MVSPITPGSSIHLGSKALKSTATGTARVIPQNRWRNDRRETAGERLERLQVREKPLERKILYVAAG